MGVRPAKTSKRIELLYCKCHSGEVLRMRPGRPVCCFMAPAGAEVMPRSHDVLCHPETLVFELSRLG